MSRTSCIDLLREFVAIPSVNPMGREDLPTDIVGERRYAEAVAATLQRSGVDAAVIGRGARASVVGEVRAAGARDTLLVASHLDTVPVDGMEIAPFDPVVSDGRLFGRGSCDTKAGMAALLIALGHTLEAGTLRRNLIVVGEADEERGSVGVRDVLTHLGGRRPRWAIATEPTGLRVVTHHKGIALLRLEAHGVACHSSDPSKGRSAISALARAVLMIESLGLQLSRHADPILGPGTMSVGQIGGGAAPNIVPDAAWLLCDRRLLPGETAQSVRDEVAAALVGAGLAEVSVAMCVVGKPALGISHDHPAVRDCARALSAEAMDAAPDVVAFGTDAGLFFEAGIPAVVFGPGSIAQAHTAREFVDVAQVETASRVFRRVLESPGDDRA